MTQRILYGLIVCWAGWFVLKNNLPHFADDPGVGWHLKTGEWIVEHKAVPYKDPFLGSDTERRWICDQWLSDILLYLLYTMGSWFAVYFCLFIIYFYGYFVVLFHTLKEMATPNASALFATVFAFKAGLIHFILRPTLFGIFFFLLVFCFLLRRAPSQGFCKREAIALFSLFLLWANMHPSFVLGLGLLLLYVIASPRRIACNIILLLLATSATFLNPELFNLHQSILFLSRSDFFMNLNQEWRPIILNSGAGRIWIMISVLAFASYMSSAESRSRTTTFILLVAIVFAFSSLKSVRLLPYYGIACAPLMSLAITSLLTSRFLKKFSLFGRKYEGLVNDSNSIPLRLSLICIFFASLSILSQQPLGPSTMRYPYEIVAYLNSTIEEEYRVFTSPDYGGFLTFSLHRGKAVIDDRNTMLGEKIYKDYLLANESEEALIRFMGKYHADFLVVHRSREDSSLRQFKRMFCSSQHCLYRMKSQKFSLS